MVLGAQLTESDRVPVLALTRRHPLVDGELTLLGGHSSVTGVMTRIELGGRRVLVDCGLPQGAEAFEWELDAAAADVDAVLLTQAHEDHVGGLPALIERGFSGPIYGTPATLAVARVVLEDSLGLQGFSPAEAVRLIGEIYKRTRPLGCDQRESLGGELAFEYRQSGHLLGSASIELLSAKSRVICSGDLGRPESPLLPDYATSWKSGRPVDLVLMECTYGDEDHPPGGAVFEQELERIMLRALERCGHVLVPAFAIGPLQGLLLHLDNLARAGRIPALPIAIDNRVGAGVTRSYADFSRLFDRGSLDRIARGDELLDLDDLYSAREHEHSQRLSIMPGPMLIVAGNSMCTGGRIVPHLRRLLPLEHTTLLLIGYQAEGTPGRAIQRAAARGGRAWLDHEEVRVRAEVETLSGLAGHADRGELARWLAAIPDVRQVALHHGEPKAQRSFAAWHA